MFLQNFHESSVQVHWVYVYLLQCVSGVTNLRLILENTEFPNFSPFGLIRVNCCNFLTHAGIIVSIFVVVTVPYRASMLYVAVLLLEVQRFLQSVSTSYSLSMELSESR